MRFFYDFCYLLLLTILSPWIAWRFFVQRKNRRGWAQKLLGWVPVRNSSKRCAWIHAVSVGEVNLLDSFVAAFRSQHSDIEIAISTTTETGFDLARRKFPAETVFFCPADFSWAIENAIKRLRPDILILTELELWPNLISVTHARRIPVALINGRVSEKSYRGYQRLGWLVRRFLKHIDLTVMQTGTYAHRLESLGMPAERIHVCGNIKFDLGNMADLADLKIRELAKLANVVDGDFVFVAGSTQENEDRILIAVFRELIQRHPQLRLILVPRHPDRCQRLARILRDQGLAFAVRSELIGSITQSSECRILVVDVIGELRLWWTLADACYVGGSIGHRGGQNMIEPAACGVPISFGPNTENFRDVVELLLSETAAVVVEDEFHLQQFVSSVLNDPDSAREMGLRAKSLVARQRGATAETIELIGGVWKRAVKSVKHPQQAA